MTSPDEPFTMAERRRKEPWRDRVRGWTTAFFLFFFFSSPHQLFASSAPWALRRGGASTHSHLNKRGGWRWRCKELLCFFFHTPVCITTIPLFGVFFYSDVDASIGFPIKWNNYRFSKIYVWFQFNLPHQMEGFLNPLHLPHVSIWWIAHRKHLERAKLGVWVNH